MAVSLGPIVYGAALPHPDTDDCKTMFDGVCKRMGAKRPHIDLDKLRRYKNYVGDFLKENFVPLPPDADLSFETWIAKRPYPDWRKKELTEVYQSMAKFTLEEKWLLVKCFMKDETYVSFKHGRGIYARSDYFKVLFGPIISAIEEVLYNHESFIKHVPVPDRPEYIERLFDFHSEYIYGTDYTSFEASFTEEVMDATDHQLYSYFTSQLNDDFIKAIFQAPSGINQCIFKWFVLYIRARRMSGEMSTSACNGFANLTLMKFIAQEQGVKIKMVVEGDDGLTKANKELKNVTQEASSLGFQVKLEIKTHANLASFCGIIYDPQDKVNVTDPREILCEFGWANKRYAKANKKRLLALLRCKALSYLYQYAGCPIIQELALYGLRMTKSYDVRHFIVSERSLSLWERQIYADSLKSLQVVKPIGFNTRLLVEKEFGISVDAQFEIERMLRDKNELTPLYVSIDFPPAWVEYFRRYVYFTADDFMFMYTDPQAYFQPDQEGVLVTR